MHREMQAPPPCTVSFMHRATYGVGLDGIQWDAYNGGTDRTSILDDVPRTTPEEVGARRFISIRDSTFAYKSGP